MQRRTLAWVALVVLATGGCGGGGSDASGGSGGKGGSGGNGLDGGTDAPVNLDAGDAASSYGCSADLHSVVDANGTVVETCPPDQGCAGGQCIDACSAAASSH